MKPAESMRLLHRVEEIYARRLRESPEAAKCLQTLNLGDGALLANFRAGYCDGTLAGLLPKSGELRDALRAAGVLDGGGRESLLGGLVVPVIGAGGAIQGFCGIRPGAGSGPEQVVVPETASGLGRGTLAKIPDEIFVTCQALDAFALWTAGFTNVVVAVGKSACLAQLEQVISEIGCHRVYLCVGSGEREKLAAADLISGLEKTHTAIIQGVIWPAGISGVREFFRNHTAEEFKALLPRLEPDRATAATSPAIREVPEGLDAHFDDRHYELRMIQKPGAGRLRSTTRAVGDQGRFVIETLDFYCSRSRRGFLSETARLFHKPLEVIEQDLNRLTEEVERYVQRREQQLVPQASVPGADDRAQGLSLGRMPDLVGQVVRDMGSLGLIGEEANKLLSYLVMTSRKLADPLALLILSGSGAGKSRLQDTVLALCPPEDLVKLTSLTDQALFYRGEHSLRHKVLALEESAGAKGADYAVRNLISAKKLVIETTVRNSLTGKLETQVNTVQGPTAVFQTTTDPQAEAQTRSRFIVISVDESAAQTRAILATQRRAHTLEGLRLRQERERILRRHHAFQRLLRPLPVVNPFEPLLSYPDDNLVVRRDQPKYLQLILAVAFLQQMQRTLRHDSELGEYLEATLDDIAVANALAHQIFGHSLADVSEPGRQLLTLIEAYMRSKAARTAGDKDTFSRRELREAIHWGDTRLRIHLRELVELEYVAPLSGRQGLTYHYRLLSRPDPEAGRFLAGLKSVEQLRIEASLAGLAAGSAPASHPAKREVAAGLTIDDPKASQERPDTPHPCGPLPIFTGAEGGIVVSNRNQGR